MRLHLSHRGVPELAEYFPGFGLRAHALCTDRDAQFWIDALVRSGKLKADQLVPADIKTNKYNDIDDLAQQ